jgi:large subunit ribosomal protein L31
MRENIHPATQEITGICGCGNEISFKSTIKSDIRLDVCSKCHPFYTGRQKMVDTAGRIKTFEKRYYRGKKTQNAAEDGANRTE